MGQPPTLTEQFANAMDPVDPVARLEAQMRCLKRNLATAPPLGTRLFDQAFSTKPLEATDVRAIVREEMESALAFQNERRSILDDYSRLTGERL